MTSYRTGETVADLTFQTPDNNTRSLSEFRGRPLLLIFLRHLA